MGVGTICQVLLLLLLIGIVIAKIVPMQPEIAVGLIVLAIAITAGLLNNPDMAVPAAVYSLLMYVTGFGAILYGRQAIGDASSLK